MADHAKPPDQQPWLRTQYEMAHHDIWWVKAQQMNVGQWTLLLLGALVAVGHLLKADWPTSPLLRWILIVMSGTVTGLGIAHVWDLHFTLVRSRDRAARIVQPLTDPVFEEVKRSGKRHRAFPIAITIILFAALALVTWHFMAVGTPPNTARLASPQSLQSGSTVMAMPVEVIAALFGAVAGGVSSIGIEWGKTFLYRRRRAKAIKIALYYEIFGHSIVEVAPSPDKKPNFVILGFARASYDAYLDEIPDFLPENLVGDISLYYAKVTTAASQQASIEDDITRAREVARQAGRLGLATKETSVHAGEFELLKQEGQQVADRMLKVMAQNRLLLSVAMWQQEKQLLPILRKEFKNDPSQRPLNVVPKYREWAEKTTDAKVIG